MGCFDEQSEKSGQLVYPPDQVRYLHYRGIAKLLGVAKERVKLPCCVQEEIAKLYPDAEGAPTKVGFKRQRECRPSRPDRVN